MKTIDPQNITTQMIDALCKHCKAIESLPSREVNKALKAFLEAAPEVNQFRTKLDRGMKDAG